jgi:hypothetical protein
MENIIVPKYILAPQYLLMPNSSNSSNILRFSFNHDISIHDVITMSEKYGKCEVTHITDSYFRVIYVNDKDAGNAIHNLNSIHTDNEVFVRYE